MIHSIVIFIGILVIVFSPLGWCFHKLKMKDGDEISLTLLGLIWAIAWLMYFMNSYTLIFKITLTL